MHSVKLFMNKRFVFAGVRVERILGELGRRALMV